MKTRRLLFIPAVAAAAGLLWTSMGTFSSASGQEKAVLIDRAHKGGRAPNFDKPIFLLVLGGDHRVGNSDRARYDSIHILSIVPGDPPKASLLGIPRDTYVEVPGHGKQRINTGGFYGGISLEIQTVERVTGCRFDYYMYTSFVGFRGKKPDPENKYGLINEIGGIHLKVDKNYNEGAPSKLRKGYQLLNGKEALSWARNRHERPAGDFDRSFAQGVLMIAALREARADFKENPGTALRNLGALRRNVKLNIGLTESLELGLYTMRVNPKTVENEHMKGGIGSAGAASIVTYGADARAQFADICSDGQLNG